MWFVQVACLLVASVAAQSSMELGDSTRWGNMDRSMIGRRSGMGLEDLLRRERTTTGLQGLRGMEGLWGMDTIIPTINRLSLEELVETPLFRVYWNIPLFRQFWEEHPVVFRKYVSSVLFQQFWTVPAFVQYFRNPVLFYKYILPQVQLIAHRHETLDGLNFHRRNILHADILDKLFGGRIGENNWMTPSWMNRGEEGTFGRRHLDFQTKHLLEKMIRNLILNGEKKVEETLTDVRVLNNGHVKETTVGKILDPITGEEKITLGDIKVNIRNIVQNSEISQYICNSFPSSVKYSYLRSNRISLCLFPSSLDC
jgi:hypothetical protein